MNTCSQCGSQIPDGQRICSMCMGDIDHGKDGYYRQWAEEQEMKREQQNEHLLDHPDYWQAQQALLEYEVAKRFLIEASKEDKSFAMLSGTMPTIIKAMINYKNFALSQIVDTKDELPF